MSRWTSCSFSLAFSRWVFTFSSRTSISLILEELRLVSYLERLSNYLPIMAIFLTNYSFCLRSFA
jgi:hypothetical protein